MSEAKHTEGPWFVHDFTNPDISPDATTHDVTVSCDHPATIEVASMGRAMTATLAEARANACLIAAAPDMLDALRQVEAMIEKDRQPIPGGPVHTRILAAIAKATA